MSRQERETPVRRETENVEPVAERPAMKDSEHVGTMTTARMETTDVRGRDVVEGPVTWAEMRALLRREPTYYERTWRPTTGGLLEIMAGAWNLILGLGGVIGGSAFSSLLPTFGGVSGGSNAASIGGGAFFVIIGILSIVGGALALSRRGWPVVLAGSIAALIPSPIILPFIMGIFALIFNVLGHKEFWGPEQFARDYQSNVEHNIEKSR